MKVLVVEDDTVLAAALVRALNQAAYTVDLADDGEAANSALAITSYDLVILDIALPKVDGLSVLRRLRDRRSTVLVLMLTARDALEERVEGLHLGADDYMTEPFDLPENEARVRALVRRGQLNAGIAVAHTGRRTQGPHRAGAARGQCRAAAAIAGTALYPSPYRSRRCRTPPCKPREHCDDIVLDAPTSGLMSLLHAGSQARYATSCARRRMRRSRAAPAFPGFPSQ